jgi:hypothetical protein
LEGLVALGYVVLDRRATVGSPLPTHSAWCELAIGGLRSIIILFLAYGRCRAPLLDEHLSDTVTDHDRIEPTGNEVKIDRFDGERWLFDEEIDGEELSDRTGRRLESASWFAPEETRFLKIGGVGAEIR